MSNKTSKSLFYIYTFFSGLLFFMPVLLNIYVNRDINVEMIFLLEIVYYISIFIFEIPSGILGDRCGHGKIVVVGLLGTFITYLAFSAAQGMLEISIVQFFLGLFGCLVSGSDKVCFFSNLKVDFNKDQVFLLQKKANIIFVLANLISFFFGGILMGLDISGKWVFIGTGLGVFLSLLVFIFAISFDNSRKYSIKNDKSIQRSKLSFKLFLKNKTVMSWCVVSGILLAVLGNYYWIIQLYYDFLGFSNQLVGFLFMSSSLITILFSKIALFNNGNKKGMILLLIFPISYFLMPIKSHWVVPIVIILYSIIKIELQPYLENMILELEKHQQATNMSITSWINNSIQIFLLLIYSGIFSSFPFKYAVTLLGLLIFFIMLGSTRFIMNLKRGAS